MVTDEGSSNNKRTLTRVFYSVVTVIFLILLIPWINTILYLDFSDLYSILGLASLVFLLTIIISSILIALNPDRVGSSLKRITIMMVTYFFFTPIGTIAGMLGLLPVYIAWLAYTLYFIVVLINAFIRKGEENIK